MNRAFFRLQSRALDAVMRRPALSARFLPEILIRREWSRGLQPTIWFDEDLAHWDIENDLVRECAEYLESLPGVHAADHIDREVIELRGVVVPVWWLRRRARRWIRAYQASHPRQKV